MSDIHILNVNERGEKYERYKENNFGVKFM